MQTIQYTSAAYHNISDCLKGKHSTEKLLLAELLN